MELGKRAKLTLQPPQHSFNLHCLSMSAGDFGGLGNRVALWALKDKTKN
jgi:hypothetical protein